MKTERRHELQTNVLASSLAHWTENLKPYGRVFLAALLALVAALFAWMYMSSQTTSRVAQGWNDYFQAVNTRDEQLLQDVAEQYAGTMVADWSRLTLADWQLDSGTNRLLTDRTLARDQLREASEKYQALLQVSNATIRERATYGLARTFETLGDLEKARTQYSALATTWPESPFAATAAARAKELENLPTKEFYDWIAKYEPPKPLSQEPGTPGARPDFLKEPDAGTLNLPSSLGDTGAVLPNLGTDATAPAEQPEVPESTPVLPGAEAPATEPAANAETPAEPAPATTPDSTAAPQ